MAQPQDDPEREPTPEPEPPPRHCPDCGEPERASRGPRGGRRTEHLPHCPRRQPAWGDQLIGQGWTVPEVLFSDGNR